MRRARTVDQAKRYGPCVFGRQGPNLDRLVPGDVEIGQHTDRRLLVAEIFDDRLHLPSIID